MFQYLIKDQFKKKNKQNKGQSKNLNNVKKYWNNFVMIILFDNYFKSF